MRNLFSGYYKGTRRHSVSLVRKYQQGVHALVWRKIGDFHIAQEITQDAFLQAYKKLGTLKNPTQFSGWLYVIAANLCRSWFRKNRMPVPESLETTEATEVDRVSYSQYVAEKQATEADETRREVVKTLLQKLPESERTVMTLHYLGEMTIQAISEFLGVSPNTVKSRLSRARNRLRKEEDVTSAESWQLPTPGSIDRKHHAGSLASESCSCAYRKADSPLGTFRCLSCCAFPTDRGWRAASLPFSEALRSQCHLGIDG